mgnify:FL=1
MKEFQYVITDPLGIHARPAGELIKELSRFRSTITLARGEKTVDARRIFALMGLAVKQGDRIVIRAEGGDEEEAIEAAKKILTSRF